MADKLQELMYEFRSMDPAQRAALLAAIGVGVGAPTGAAVGKATGIGAGKGAGIGAILGAGAGGAGGLATPGVGLGEKFLHNSITGAKYGLPAIAGVAATVWGGPKTKRLGGRALSALALWARKGGQSLLARRKGVPAPVRSFLTPPPDGAF